MKPVRVGLSGSGFIADLHAAAIKMIPAEMEVSAVASPTEGKAAAFAEAFRTITTAGPVRRSPRPAGT